MKIIFLDEASASKMFISTYWQQSLQTLRD
uniref:Uncharacterized protein n=1 Tax=Arundo donax TaxID=35708 RepID=A0A0A8ZFF9_ARUDO